MDTGRRARETARGGLSGATTRVAGALLALTLAGCSSLHHLADTLTSRDGAAALKPYAGVEGDLRTMGLSPLYGHVGVGWISWLALMDLPFSFALDTALLPITGPAWLLGLTPDEREPDVEDERPAGPAEEPDVEDERPAGPAEEALPPRRSEGDHWRPSNSDVGW